MSSALLLLLFSCLRVPVPTIALRATMTSTRRSLGERVDFQVAVVATTMPDEPSAPIANERSVRSPSHDARAPPSCDFVDACAWERQMVARALAGVLFVALAAPSIASADPIDDALRALPRDPPLARVLDAAIEHAELDPAGVAALVSRARTSAWVPSVRLGARRGRGQDLTSLQTDASGRLTRAIDDELALDVTLTFELPRVIYGTDEVAWARERRVRVERRSELIERVITLYFRRRRLLLEQELDRRYGTAEVDVERMIALEETTALLDGFTGGRFARIVRGRAPDP